MTSPPRQRRRSLEREIIIAVIVLYLMTGVMVTVHYTQPAGQGRQHHRRRRLTASSPAASQTQSDLNKEIDNDPHNAQDRRAASFRG